MVEGMVNGVLMEVHRLNIVLVIKGMVKHAMGVVIDRPVIAMTLESVLIMREHKMMVLMIVSLTMVRRDMHMICVLTMLYMRNFAFLLIFFNHITLCFLMMLNLDMVKLCFLKSRPMILFNQVFATVVELWLMESFRCS